MAPECFCSSVGKEKPPIRVLTDCWAGVHASGYSSDHVHKKLLRIFAAARIDLMIGTHYDEDHLAGLVPIIEDRSISITQALLPPVANDTEFHAINVRPSASDFLAVQFSDEESGATAARDYLTTKAWNCVRLRLMEGLYRPLPHTRATGNGRDPERDEILERVPSIEPPYEAARDFFRRHLSEASSAIGNDGDGHADEEAVAPPEIFIDGGIFSAVLTALVGLVAVGLP